MGITLSFPDMVTSDPHKGLGMGLGWEHLKDLVKGTNVTPDFECEPSRDPQLGFEGQRKIRGESSVLRRNCLSTEHRRSDQ